MRILRPPRAAPAEAARVTRAEINLAHVRHNLREVRACLDADARARGQETPTKIWAVLKADGYGHGAAAIATSLESHGIDGLCVALLEEGLELRNAGVRAPVLVMGGYYGRFRDGVEALIEGDLTPVIYDAGQIEALAAAARFMQRSPIPVHLKIDTGMGRLGVRESGLGEMLRILRGTRELRLEGLMTHLACADSDLQSTCAQLEDFELASTRVREAGFSPTLRHAANSAALLRLPSSQCDVVRPGLAIFGVHPCAPDRARPPNLKPVMRVLSEVVALRDLPAGAAIGYGHTWQARRPSRIATIPMGYADGLSRALSNRGAVLIAGRRAPIVGTVSMDLTMVDVTDLPAISIRDEVVILGHQRGRLGEDTITADEIAAHIGTISYECLTSISRRVPRFYRHP
ncbi:MAG TPA: alanine racemase [Polyangiaceae bacterium]|nr:alanine racemase [Polyangiaceae bacterium]